MPKVVHRSPQELAKSACDATREPLTTLVCSSLFALVAPRRLGFLPAMPEALFFDSFVEALFIGAYENKLTPELKARLREHRLDLDAKLLPSYPRLGPLGSDPRLRPLSRKPCPDLRRR